MANSAFQMTARTPLVPRRALFSAVNWRRMTPPPRGVGEKVLKRLRHVYQPLGLKSSAASLLTMARLASDSCWRVQILLRIHDLTRRCICGSQSL